MTHHDLTREQRIELSERLTRDSYRKASIIDQIVNTRDCTPNDVDFIRIFRRVYVPLEWFTETNIASDLVFQEFGSDIALSEKKFLLEEKILKTTGILRKRVDAFNLEGLGETAGLLLEGGFMPTILFAPIEYYVQFYADWLGRNLQIGKDQNTVIIMGHRMHVFWSNKYIPFKQFIFIDKSFGEWVSKPSFDNRLYVKISPSDKSDQLDFLAYTIAKLSIINPRKIAILELNEPQ